MSQLSKVVLGALAFFPSPHDGVFLRRQMPGGTMYGGAAPGMGGMANCESVMHNKEKCLESAACGAFSQGFTIKCESWATTGATCCGNWKSDKIAGGLGDAECSPNAAVCGGGPATATTTAAPATPAPAVPAATTTTTPPPTTSTTTPPPTTSTTTPPPTTTTTTTPPPTTTTTTPPPPPASLVFDTTGDTFSHRDKSISFPSSFSTKPIVITGALSHDGGHSMVSEILEISPDGFKMRGLEPPKPVLDIWHTKEEVAWLAESEGMHETDSGVNYLIGQAQYTPNGRQEFRVDFPQAFKSEKLAVFLTVQAQQATDEWMAVRAKEITKDGFTVRIEEDTRKEMKKKQWHSAEESIGYLVIPEGEGEIRNHKYKVIRKSGLTHRWQNLNLGRKFQEPAVFGQITSVNGPDASTFRMKRVRGKSAKRIRVKLQEPNGKSGYGKGKHTREDFSVMIIEKK